MTLVTIQVIWMDGKYAIFPDVTASVREGVLHVHRYGTNGSGGRIIGEWHIPTSNIRWWTPDDMTTGPDLK